MGERVQVNDEKWATFNGEVGTVVEARPDCIVVHLDRHPPDALTHLAYTQVRLQ